MWMWIMMARLNTWTEAPTQKTSNTSLIAIAKRIILECLLRLRG